MLSTGIFVGLLAFVHLFAGKFRIESFVPRNAWLSIAGGISMAYVFVHLLPELAELRAELADTGDFPYLYVVTLAGVVLFYGLERLAKISKRKSGASAVANTKVFWLHASSFAIYNAVVGYTFARQNDSIIASGLFFIAMAVHFYANDYSLWNHFKEKYDRAGRYVLGASVILGWLIGRADVFSKLTIAIATALLVGGIILNGLKEEIPDESQSRFWPLALSAFGYAGLLMISRLL